MIDPALTQRVVPSLLDRLIDPASAGTAAQPGYGRAQALRSIHRDIEDLLNTHSPFSDIPSEYSELQRSPLAYGLPDVRGVDVAVAGDRRRMAAILTAVLERFEPRLQDVHVSVAEKPAESPNGLNFRITARPVFEPVPPVQFDGFLDLRTGQLSVRPGEPDV